MYMPKSNSEAQIGSPSTSTCFSSRCQPRGRISSVAICSFNVRTEPSGFSNVISRRTASRALIWPLTMLSQVGESASSKSAMNASAPEFSAPIIILRSTGPVISAQRCCRSSGVGATCQELKRISSVSERKSGSAPLSNSTWRSIRRANSSCRRALKARCNPATNASASSVKISSKPSWSAPTTSTPSGGLISIAWVISVLCPCSRSVAARSNSLAPHDLARLGGCRSQVSFVNVGLRYGPSRIRQ